MASYPTLAYREYLTNAANASKQLALSDQLRKIQEAGLTGMFNGQPTMQSKQLDAEIAATKQANELQNLISRYGLASKGYKLPDETPEERLFRWQAQGENTFPNYGDTVAKILEAKAKKEPLDNIMNMIDQAGIPAHFFAPYLGGYQGWKPGYTQKTGNKNSGSPGGVFDNLNPFGTGLSNKLLQQALSIINPAYPLVNIGEYYGLKSLKDVAGVLTSLLNKIQG